MTTANAKLTELIHRIESTANALAAVVAAVESLPPHERDNAMSEPSIMRAWKEYLAAVNPTRVLVRAAAKWLPVLVPNHPDDWTETFLRVFAFGLAEGPTETSVEVMDLHLARMRERVAVLNRIKDDHTTTTPNDAADFTHTENFESVSACGTTYYFTTAQRSIIETLYDAHRRGELGVATESMIEGSKLRDKFRTTRGKKKELHPAWGTLIVPVPDRRGLFKLSLPVPRKSTR